MVIERSASRNNEKVVVVHALFGLVREMRGTKIMGIMSFSIF